MVVSVLLNAQNVTAGYREVWLPMMGLLVSPIFLFMARSWASGLSERLKPEITSPEAQKKFFAIKAVCLFQYFLAIFMLFSVQWNFALWLMTSSAIGLAVTMTLQRRHLQLFSILSLFNFMAILGYQPLFGFSVNLMDGFDSTASVGKCSAYYSWTKGSGAICKGDGYLAWLRFLAVPLIMIQPFMVAMPYLIGEEADAEVGGGVKDPSVPTAPSEPGTGSVYNAMPQEETKA